MYQFSRTLKLLAVPVLAAIFAVQGHAQATRTWVSGVGDDANPCSRTAPCKTFAGAIAKTAPAGEINTLDPGGFGAVTITKSINIRNEGVGEAGVLVSGTNGMVIAAAATDVVTLKGLVFNGMNTGINGISFLSGGSLTVEDCRIFDFSQQGINFAPNGASSLTVLNTTITHTSTNASTFGGINIAPSGGGATFLLDHVTIANNGNFGVRVDATSAGTAINGLIKNSSVQGNTGPGVIVTSTSVLAKVTVADSSVAFNSTNGINAVSGSATITVSNSVITGNSTGVKAQLGGNTVSLGNNTLTGNGTDGTFTSTILTK